MTVATPPGAASTTAAHAAAEAGGITAGMVRLAGLVADADRWEGTERRDVLRQIDRAVDGLAAARSALLVVERAAGTWRGSGDRSFEAWLSRTSRSGERAATAQVRQADGLSVVPEAAAAVVEGRISLQHAAVIGKVASAGTPVQQEAAQRPTELRGLVQLAERLDAGTFATTVTRWAASIDPASLERDHAAQRANRYLQVTDTPRGTLIRGQVDSMAGHRLTLALEALSPRPAADDDRDHGQRCADALDAMSGKILALGDTRPGGSVPPQVTMILTAETWQAARAERERRRGAAVGGDRPEPGAGAAAAAAAAAYEPATLEDGTPVPASELATTMCDCQLTRVVLDAASVPLDLGRTERLFTGPQRRAVIARDGGCAWPTCHAHARWCEIHHIRWWERDAGPTSVENGVLLCSYHHHEVHRRDVSITRVERVLRHGPPGERGRAAVGPRGYRRVEYEFRDPGGRLVGAGGRAGVGVDKGAGVGVGVDGGAAGGGSTAAPTTTSAPDGAAEAARGAPPDELDLTPTTDPVTGMSVPAFWLASPPDG